MSPLRLSILASRCALGVVLSLFVINFAHAQTYPAFSKIIVFGDSLSDVGNLRDKMESTYLISYPGGDFNYSDGRFTNSSDTDPASHRYVGVWHEQLARTFLQLPAATASQKGGLNYAYGGATTKEGTSDRTVFNNPDPFGGGSNTVTVDNMGRQVDRYLNAQTVDPAALYVLWGGGNDLFDDASASNVTATATQVITLMNRLATAGARNFLVLNVPPLGQIPKYKDNLSKQLALNQASFDYRTQLNSNLDAAEAAFAQQSVPVKLYRVDVWSLAVRFAIAPASFGFANTSDPAQGKSSVDPDTFAFWDDIHPTTAGHFQIAQEASRVLSNTKPAAARATNESTRVAVGQGDDRAIAGFIVTGSVQKKVLIRALGPSLAQYGIAGVLPDPTLSVFDANHNVVATNNNWADSQATEIAASGLAPTDPRESAIIARLTPGTYTAVLAGVNSSTGIGLAEVYDMEPGADATFSNLSTRGFVGTEDNVLIGGLIVDQGDSPIVVLRAVGPSLSNFGVQNALGDPTLQVFDQNGVQIAANDNWKDGQPGTAKATLLFPSDDRESFVALLLAPGHYTAIVRGSSNTTGNALVEAFRVQ